MKKVPFIRFAAIFAMVLFGIVLVSCSSSTAKNCAVCGKELTSSDRVRATAANGQKVDVCRQCYAIGKTAGKCY